MSMNVDKVEASPAPAHLEDAALQEAETNDIKGDNNLAIHEMTPEEKAEALATAYMSDPGVDYRSRRGIQLICCLLACLVCGTDSGFDSGAMGAINTMKPFLSYFGLQEAAASTGIWFGVYTVGGVSAFFLNFVLPDKLGRRKAMGICNTILIMGLLLTGLAKNSAMFLLGRYFMGLGAVAASAAARSYIVELAPAKHRGFFLGSYNVVQTMGSILCSGSAIGFGHMADNWAWRGLLLLGLYGPIINISCLYFIPESPRWLYARGRTDEALAVITKYHSRHNDPQSPLVQLEIQEIAEEMRTMGSAERWWDAKVLFATRANRYRMGLAAMIGFWGQLLGPATTYFTVLLTAAGITDTERQRVLNFINSVCITLSGTVGTLMMDRVGRKPVTLFGTSSAAVGMLIIGGLLSRQHEKNYANAGVAFIYLYGIFTQVAWVPVNNLYPAEIMTFDIRAKALAFQAVCTQTAGLINTFGVPPALVALNWKLYFIFAAWDVLGVAVQFFFMVETKGIPLEQMEDIFTDQSPRHKATAIIKAKDEKLKEEKRARATAA